MAGNIADICSTEMETIKQTSNNENDGGIESITNITNIHVKRLFENIENDIESEASLIDRVAKDGCINEKKDGKTALILSAEKGLKHTVDKLALSKADLNIHLETERETALTLVREERILLKLAKFANLYSDKLKYVKEEDIREKLDEPQPNASMDHKEYVEIFKKILKKTFSDEEKSIFADKFKKVEAYNNIRRNLLKFGGYDVRKIKYPETR